MATENQNKKLANCENSDEIKKTPNLVPEWLKSELFENVLKSTVPGYKKIKNFKAFKAMAAGENYATLMLRVELEVEAEGNQLKSHSYMLKLPHDIEMFRAILTEHNIFDVERGMYLDIIPEMEQLYRDVGLDVKFGAACYTLPIENMNVLLEDLRPRGFKNANRLEGLDDYHTKCVLRKLALWHAASAYRVEIKGRYADKYMYGFYVDSPAQKELFKSVKNKMSDIILQSMKLYKGHEEYYESVLKLQPQITEELLKRAKIDSNEFNVLNHGDCWSNNVMFQYDAFGKIKETYFVDYQMPKYGSPAQDLYYFLLSSTKFEIKLKQFEYFVKYYHDHLIEALKLLKYPKKMPQLKDIHCSLYRHGIWGFNTATGIMAGILLDPTEMANVEHFFTESPEATDFKRLMYTNARYMKHIEAVLPWLYHRGAIDC